MKIVTGYTGENHVTSNDDRGLHAGIIGDGCYVLEVGDRFYCEQDANNKLIVGSGELVINGTHARNETQEVVTVPNGTIGMMRRDVLSARYTRTGQVESVDLIVLSGEPDINNPQLPTMYLSPYHSVLEGSTIVDFPLWEIVLDGVNIVNIVDMVQNLITGAGVTDHPYFHGRAWSLWQIQNDIWQKIYPVGSVYITTSDHNPQDLFGGSWDRFSQGQVLLGAGQHTDGDGTTVNYANGYESGLYRAKINTNEIPAHTHNVKMAKANANIESHYIKDDAQQGSQVNIVTDIYYDDLTTESTGGTQSHYNMQPFVTVNIWKRVL